MNVTKVLLIAITLTMPAAAAISLRVPDIPDKHVEYYASIESEKNGTVFAFFVFEGKPGAQAPWLYDADGSGNMVRDPSIDSLRNVVLLAGPDANNLHPVSDLTWQVQDIYPEKTYLFRTHEKGIHAARLAVDVVHTNGYVLNAVVPTAAFHDLVQDLPPELPTLSTVGNGGDQWGGNTAPCQYTYYFPGPGREYTDVDMQDVYWGGYCNGADYGFWYCDDFGFFRYPRDGYVNAPTEQYSTTYNGNGCNTLNRRTGEMWPVAEPRETGRFEMWTPCYRPGIQDGFFYIHPADFNFGGTLVSGGANYGLIVIYVEGRSGCGSQILFHAPLRQFTCAVLYDGYGNNNGGVCNEPSNRAFSASFSQHVHTFDGYQIGMGTIASSKYNAEDCVPHSASEGAPGPFSGCYNPVMDSNGAIGAQARVKANVLEFFVYQGIQEGPPKKSG